MDEETKNRLSRKAFAILIKLPQIERSLKLLLTWVFSEKEADSLTLEDIESSNTKLRKATLGRLIRLLEERLMLQDEFKMLMERVLADRNTFIHRLGDEGYIADDPPTISRLESFLDRLIADSVKLERSLFRIVWLWKEHAEIKTDWDDYYKRCPHYKDIVDADAEDLAEMIKAKKD